MADLRYPNPSHGAPTCVARTRDADATRALGVRIGHLLRGGDVVALHGALGAGKTTLTQGIAVGLHVSRNVTSPTFTLVNPYHGRDEHGESEITLLHVDLYRLSEGDSALLEVESLGLDEFVGAPDAIVIVEWAERIAAWFPPETVHIALDGGDSPDDRSIWIYGSTTRAEEIANALQ